MLACFLRRYEPDQVRRVCGVSPHSQRARRSPEAVFGCAVKPSTLASARRRRRRGSRDPPARCAARGAGPGRSAARRPGAPSNTSDARGGTSPSSRPWRTSVGTADPACAGAHPCLLGERLRPEPGGAGRAVERVAVARRPTSGSRDSVSGAMPFGTDSVGRTGPRTGASRFFQPASVESRPGAVSTVRSGSRPIREQVAGRDQRRPWSAP